MLIFVIVFDTIGGVVRNARKKEINVSMYDFELIWDNGKKSALVTHQAFLNDNPTEKWYCGWAGNEIAKIVSKITDEGEIDRRIEVHVNAPDKWKADACRVLAQLYDLIGFFTGDKLSMSSIVIVFD